ncbi:MAG: hypothetical protein M8357_15910 [Desulfobulbaceae bacterium]|nr:hypothetical protein [Desulfobulbaceae bacterium]
MRVSLDRQWSVNIAMADDPARTTAGSHLPDSTSVGLFTAAIPRHLRTGRDRTKSRFTIRQAPGQIRIP